MSEDRVTSRRTILRSLMGVNDGILDKYIKQSFLLTRKHDLGFNGDETTIYNYICNFFDTYGDIPSLARVDLEFSGNIEVKDTLDKIYKLSPFFGENFKDIVLDIKEQTRCKKIVDLLKEVADIARDKLVLNEGRYSKEVLKGSDDALKHLIKGAMGMVNISGKSGTLSTSDPSEYIKQDMAKFNEKNVYLPSGFDFLDKNTNGGIKSRSMWVLAAATGQCKTTTSLNMIYHQVIYCDSSIGLIALEEQSYDMINAFISIHSANTKIWGKDCLPLSKGDLADPKNLSVEQSDRKAEIIKDLMERKGRFVVYEGGDKCDTATVKMWMMEQEVVIEKPLDCVYIDYSEMMKLSGNSRDDYHQRLGETIKELRHLTLYHNDVGCRIVLCHQISRTGYDKAAGKSYNKEKQSNGRDGRYTTNDLAGSTTLERTASVIVTLFMSDIDQEMSTIKMGHIKNRQGKKEDYKTYNTRLQFGQIDDSPLNNFGVIVPDKFGVRRCLPSPEQLLNDSGISSASYQLD